MPPVTRTLRVGSSDIPVETIRALHAELNAVGFRVEGADASGTPRFGMDTYARVREFQILHRLSPTGDVDPLTGAVMSLSALAATERDRTRLRAALREAEGAVAASPDYEYWLARYAIMAGDYELAARVSPRLGDLSAVTVDLGEGVFTDGIGAQPPRAPEVAFPENFYSYRYDVMAQDDIDALRQSATASTSARLFSIALRPGNGTTDTFDPPHRPTVYAPPPVSTGGSSAQRLADSALAWLGAIEAWQFGNAESARQRYASAVDAYDRCQQATLSYFSIFPDYDLQFTAKTVAERMDELVWRLASDTQTWADVWKGINWRRQLLSLAELSEFDWARITPGHIVYQLLQGNLAGSPQPPPPTNPIGPQHRKVLMDTRLLLIAAVLVTLARGEANRLRRQYGDARDDFARVLRTEMSAPTANPPQTVPAVLACTFIEVPFARLLRIETLLDEGETQYKARRGVDDETHQATKSAQLAKLAEIAQDFTTRHIPGAASNGTTPLQHLVAAITYAAVFDEMKNDGAYVERTKQAMADLQANVAATVGSGDVTSLAFQSLGQTVTIETVSAVRSSLPGLTDGTHPHEPYLQFTPPSGQQAMRERNPRVYALLVQAVARLLQIWSGFNYLGYRDDYVPPWRFQYLLDRARYFAEHAKNAQRDFLNFLSNAESEEFKEMSAAQNVELEKANVQIETARVDQAAKEVAVSQEGAKLAELHAQNAQAAFSEYKDFKAKADEADAKSFIGSILGAEAQIASGRWIEGSVTLFNELWGGSARFDAATAQRSLEKHNLERTAAEAAVAASEASKRVAAAQAGLIVAGLQRQVALLRHEVALHNLQFMRNRALNTEQWYRLASAIRNVSETYLRYAIETAFLAQQTYNFEADRRLNVIRFDYDLSAVGAMLAADFLLRDLDGLEQDLVVTQQTRLQPVRYVLSLARDFPETLRVLADEGTVLFSTRLEQLERRFPGLFGLRISNLEVQPIALMDPARTSVQLTHLGTGMIRVKAQPGMSPLNTTDLQPDNDWLTTTGTEWPVKVDVCGPHTAVFTGLSRQDTATASAVIANERQAFEGLPGASSWRIDMSMKENQVVSGTLADVLLTFTLTGLYDPGLDRIVGDAVRSAKQSFATTSFVSARRTLPDAFYSLAHYGRMDWTLSDRMVTPVGTANELRNLAVMLPLVQNGVELGRCYCRYPIRIHVAPGVVSVLSVLPELSMTANGVTLDGDFTGPSVTDVTWEFGDNTPLAHGATVQHVYARPGRYELSTRLVRDRKLVEYRSAIVVSANHPVVAPLIIVPTLSAGAASVDGTIPVSVSLPPGTTEVSIDCVAGRSRASSDGGPATLHLRPGSYVIDFKATRKLHARFYGRQRYLPAVPLMLSRGRMSTNRTFDPETGLDTTASPNAFTEHLFGDGSFALSPADRWTLEVPLADNPWFMTVSPSDVAEFDGGELSDAVMILEFSQGAV
jgi:hypothetical protein